MGKLGQYFIQRKEQFIKGAALLLAAMLVFLPLANANVQDQRVRITNHTLYLDDADFEKTQTVILGGVPWLTLDQVQKRISVSSDAKFTVERIDESHFGIKIENPGRRAYTVTYYDEGTGYTLSRRVNEPVLTVRFAEMNPGSFPVDSPIILEFSDPVDEIDLWNYISLSPEIPFEMFGRDRYVYLYPYYPLDYNTEYTVTIGKGLRSFDHTNLVKETVTLTLKTQEKGFGVSLMGAETSVITASAKELEFHFNTYIDPELDTQTVPVQVEVYRFANLDSYLTETPGLLSGADSPEHLVRESAYTHQLTDKASSFAIPSPGLGGYLVQMTLQNPKNGEEMRFRRAFSVTDLSVYAQTSGTQTLVWANSSVTGGPLSGYRVQFLTTGGEKDAQAFIAEAAGEAPPTEGEPAKLLVEATTDADGVALVNYTADSDSGYGYYSYQRPTRTICLRDPSGEVVYVDNTNVLNLYNNQMQPNRYYSFLMLDRPLYRPTDEIQFWGVVRPWQGNRDPMPSTVRVILGEGHIDQEVTLSLAADGTFQGKMELDAVKSAGYRMMLKLPSSSNDYDEYTLATEYIQVKEFQKPAYVISTQNDKDFYLPGEQVTVEVKPTFYDGTPMPYFEMEFMLRDGSYGDWRETRKITTDSEGIALVTFEPHQSERRRGWLPSTGSYMVKISDDGENISKNGSYRYLPSSTVVAATIAEEDQKLNLTLETYALNTSELKTVEDLNKINQIDYYYDYYGYSEEQLEALRGAPQSVKVSVELQYNYYKTHKEWVYNEWSRSSHYVDRWTWQTEKKTIEVMSENGVARMEDILSEFPYDNTRYAAVNVNMTYTDSAGKACSSSYYWYNGGRPMSQNEEIPTVSPGYHFLLTDQTGTDVTGDYEYYLSYNQAAYSDGDTMNFHLRYQDGPAENKGRILYTVLQEEIVRRGVITESSLSLRQSIANANSFNLVAAYFDGTNVWPIRNTVVTFDKKSIALDVKVTPDKESYRPGENATLSVEVTDRDGNGVAGVTGISIVDESIFALQEQDIDVMYSLYKDFFFSHYYVPKYATGQGDFVHEYGMGDGGKGGETNLSFLDKLRKNFRDTALFRLVRTDSSGRATTTFQLPDNVTSWRITGVAIGDNLYAGQSRSNFVTTLPFFVNPVISSKYIDGDDIALLVQGHGVALNEQSDIFYTVNIKGDGVDMTKVAENKAYKTNQINFGKLPQGEYIVTVSASSGEHVDAVELPLAVIKSNLELVISKPVDLAKPLEISAVRYPVTLTFYDQSLDPYYSSISSLLTHYCMMASQRMSRFTAKQSLARYMDESAIPQHIRATSENIADMQNYDGGIGTAPGNPSDPYVTAMVLILAKDQFNHSTMGSYFETVMADTRNPKTQAYCYLGLAVLGHPITGELRELAGAEDTDEFLRAYCIAGLAALGEQAEATELYEKYITPGMQSSGEQRYHKNEDITSAAWVAASLLGHPDADGISLRYAAQRWRIATLFECMVYIHHYDKEVPARTLTYSVGGEDIELNLGLRGQRSISFNRSEFEALKIVDFSEEVTARAYYIGEPEEVDIEPSEEISISRELTPIDDNRYKVTLTIDFHDGAPTGGYDISEWVPSNMRLYSVDRTNRYYGDFWWYNYSTEGQKIYFHVNRYRSTVNQIKLYYTAQKTYDAEAVVDSAYIIHGESGINNMTPKTTVR